MITFQSIIFCYLIVSIRSSVQREYQIERKFEDSSYKGTTFVTSNRINGAKFYPSKYSIASSLSSSPILPNNGAINSSLEESFEEYLHHSLGDQLKINLRTGLSELEIPIVDPYLMEKIHLEPLIVGDPFNVQLKNFRIVGLSNFMVRELSSKLSELRFKIELLFPKLSAECQYIVNGTLYNVFDVNGSGSGAFEYTDVLLRTTVGLELNNGTLSLTGAEPPFVDYARSTISLKSTEGRITLPSSSISNEIGPVLFWMLADELVHSLESHAFNYLNSTVKTFNVPANFKPVVTWLVKRTSPSSSLLFRKLSPISLISNVFHALSSVKQGINLPVVIENLRHIKSNFRSNLRRFL